MITVIVAVVVGCGGWAAAYYAGDFGMVWSIVCGVVGFGVVQGVAGWLIRKRVMRVMDRIQSILGAGQKQLQTKMARWQFRPPGSMAAAQREIQDDTRRFVREALVATEGLSKFRWWVPMIERQKATAQFQLRWMIKDFKGVDALMDKVMMLDPTMAAIKMARMYTLERPTEEIGKVYRKAVRRVKYNGNVLLAATWSWILVKRDDADGAFKALTEALKKSDDATLKANHEALMNNRLTHFNNSGIGDTWYSLYLEEPRVRTQRQHGRVM